MKSKKNLLQSSPPTAKKVPPIQIKEQTTESTQPTVGTNPTNHTLPAEESVRTAKNLSPQKVNPFDASKKEEYQ